MPEMNTRKSNCCLHSTVLFHVVGSTQRCSFIYYGVGSNKASYTEKTFREKCILYTQPPHITAEQCNTLQIGCFLPRVHGSLLLWLPKKTVSHCIQLPRKMIKIQKSNFTTQYKLLSNPKRAGHHFVNCKVKCQQKAEFSQLQVIVP